MIDEKKLIEFINSKEFSLRIIRSSKSVQEILCDFIEERIRVGEWIPCSDRLPEQTIETTDGVYSSEPAIVTIKNEERVSSSVDFLIDGKWACSAADDEIIAWQPLPEPYKEDN